MTIKLNLLTFDCANAATLAEFWSQALDQKLDPDPTETFASIGLHDSDRTDPAWLFAQVPEPKSAKNRMHPDLITPDREAEVARLLTLGATKVADVAEDGMRWTTLQDPEGNEFDVIAQPA